LTKNAHRQETWVANRPPSGGDAAGPSAIGSKTVRVSRALASGGRVLLSIDVATGMSMPPAAPCTNRQAMSIGRSAARPHAALPSPKATIAVLSTRRSPNCADSHAADGIAIDSAST
jgi:hypothetical protein